MLDTKIIPMRCAKRITIERRRDYVKDKTGTRLLLLCIAACCLFWVGIFSLIF